MLKKLLQAGSLPKPWPKTAQGSGVTAQVITEWLSWLQRRALPRELRGSKTRWVFVTPVPSTGQWVVSAPGGVNESEEWMKGCQLTGPAAL